MIALLVGCGVLKAVTSSYGASSPALLARPEPYAIATNRSELRNARVPRTAGTPRPSEPERRELNLVKPVVGPTPLDEEQAARHLARALRVVLGEPPSEEALAILWAHWAHETGRGQYMLGHNFGGLKGHGPEGGAPIWTRESVGPRKELLRRTFRVYESPEQGALDYVKLLSERYSVALRAAREGRADRFVEVLGARGYYTEDIAVYQRAITLLALEFSRRSLARRALDAEDSSAKAAPTRRATRGGLPQASAAAAAGETR